MPRDLKRSLLMLFPMLISTFFASSLSLAANVRDPVWSGSFYPDEKKSLETSIAELSDRASTTNISNIPPGMVLKALVLPHAGYIYSGWTAAHASRVLSKDTYSKVVLLAPDHRVGIRNGAISDAELFRTPLGFIKVHKDGEMLRNQSTLFRVVEATDRSEHSLEVILPFLQYYLGSFELVPIVLGESDTRGVAEALSTVMDDETLLVVSSDLSHYLPYDAAVKKDRSTIESVITLDEKFLADDRNSACGREGLRVLIELAKKTSWQPVLLHYSNSGDTAGDRNRVVGYATIAFFGDDTMKDARTSELISEAHGEILVKLARKTISEKLGIQVDPSVVSKLEKGLDDPVFKSKRGVFVTLHKHGQLRGCIGSLTGAAPIDEGVRNNALNAAFNDYRFRPVIESELKDIDLEVSVLTDPQPLQYNEPDELVQGIRPKVDGLIIRKGMHSATFLPQVWDQLPDPEAFLSHLCKKAGLAPDEWKHGGLEVQTYQVQYFAEGK